MFIYLHHYFLDARTFKNPSSLTTEKSFLERDNYEKELGLAVTNGEDPFGEDFTDVANNEIIDVFCDGDLVARFIVINYK